MSILLEYASDVLLEAYYGKPKEFIEIEKKLEKVIEMVKLTKEQPNKAVDINSMKEVHEIEMLFTKFFGNAETSITFYTPVPIPLFGSPAYNAFTIPSSLSYFKKDPSNPRIARAHDLFINVNVDIGLIYGLDMSPSELMSIILHEIGHCFDASFFMLLSNISIAYSIWYKNGVYDRTEIDWSSSLTNTFMTFLSRSKPMAKLMQMVNRIMSTNPTLNDIISSLMTFITDIGVVIGTLSTLPRILNGGTPPIMAMLNPNSLFGYSAEKFADRVIEKIKLPMRERRTH